MGFSYTHYKELPSGYDIHSSPWKDPPIFKNGKPSIPMDHGFTMAIFVRQAPYARLAWLGEQFYGGQTQNGGVFKLRSCANDHTQFWFMIGFTR